MSRHVEALMLTRNRSDKMLVGRSGSRVRPSICRVQTATAATLPEAARVPSVGVSPLS